MPFISFEEVEKLATIEELAEMLGLKTKRYNANQIRCSCPIHGGEDTTLAISPGVRSKRGSSGVFFCQKGKSGGDRIGLVAHCMDIGQQDAAFFIAEQYGQGTEISTDTVTSTVSKNRATVPQKQKAGDNQPKSFDPAAFASKLTYLAELGITEDEAKTLGVGEHRGKLYIALRDEYGHTAGFVSAENLKFPKTLLVNPSVVKLKRA